MGAGIMAGSMAMQAYQGYSQSRAEKAAGNLNSQILAQNAEMSELQAQDAIARGDKEAERVRVAVRKTIGSQRASFGAQGVDVNTGSAVDAQASSAAEGAQDELTVKNNAWREAFGYRAQKLDYQTRSEMARLEGKNKSKNTLLTTGISMLGTAASYSRAAK